MFGRVTWEIKRPFLKDDMCILCDLFKGDEELRAKAYQEVDNIIELCQEIAGGYKSVRSGHVKPHTEEMKRLIGKEKSLIRILIQDIL